MLSVSLHRFIPEVRERQSVQQAWIKGRAGAGSFVSFQSDEKQERLVITRESYNRPLRKPSRRDTSQ